jgi:hypothetical protein
MSTAVIPEPIAQLQRQLDQFRSTQPGRRKLPESLWQAAVELAREHGVYSVAHPLRLDYMGLKKRLGGVSRLRPKASKPVFVELIAPHTATLKECVIEFEPLRGGKVRIQWKAGALPDWLELARETASVSFGATRRLDSESRFRRWRSARISAAP